MLFVGALFFLSVLKRANDSNFKNYVEIINLNHQLQRMLNIEKQLQEVRAQNEVSIRLAAMGDIAGGMAHEINNPLGIIGGFNYLIEKTCSSNS
jgi:signal transduction histidine kinase